MKEATGELNLTVIAILVIAALGALVVWMVSDDQSPVRKAIVDRFTSEVSRDTQN